MKLTHGSRPAPLPCKQVCLSVLLDGDETHRDFQQVSTHVEACAHCQHQLTELAGQRHEWEQISDLLRSYPDSELEALHSSSSTHAAFATGTQQAATAGTNQQLREHLGGLLEPPQHPEMLGRLGRYEIEGVIGSGGMGVVLRGFDTELHRPVAIKILAQHLAHSGAARQRFARESRAAAAVVHEHVVAIHDVDTDGKTPYLVMQYVAGESLQARVDRDGPLLVKEVLRIGAQTAAGLHAAHSQGVVHRDIKPANILLERGIERVLVTDFGLARTVDDASLTHTGVIAGTPHYMSPEQALGQATDLRTDLFSLGAVLYFMATGHAPFRAEKAMGVLNRICHEPHRPVWEVNPDVPDELSDIIDRLLSKKVSRRYASAIEVHQQLSHTLASLQQPRPLAFRKTKRWLRQHARPLIAVAAGLSVVSAIGLYLLMFSGLSTGAADGDARNAVLSPQVPSADQVPSRAQVAAQEVGSEPPRAFSLEVWQMALTDDPQAWRTQVEQLSRDLERSWPSSPHYLPQPSPGHAFEQNWQNKLDSVHRQIDSLRGSY